MGALGTGMDVNPENRSVTSPAPAWVTRQDRLNNWLVNDLLGGPRPWKFSWVINFQKGGTFPFLGALMAWYGNDSSAAWVYLALQGGYGLVWLLKALAFPDPAWERRITVAGGIMAFLGVLGWYWVFGWLLISGRGGPPYPLPEPAWFALCITLCLVGCAIMIAADAQKYFTLRVRKGLITNGMFSLVRHPNYLGEMMIYGSFALMVWHWLPFLVLAWVWLGVFLVNMAMKESRMSRHPEWDAYRARTGWLLPRPLALFEGLRARGRTP